MKILRKKNAILTLSPAAPHPQRYYTETLSVSAGGAGLGGQEGISGTAVGGITCGKGVVKPHFLVSRMIPMKKTMPRNTATKSNAMAAVHFG